MAHILFISPYYPPEKAAAAVCVSENAKRLARRGHRVTVLTTFPNYPTGIVPSEYRGRLLRQETLDGVRVIRVWSYTNANKGFWGRILAQLSFGCLSSFLGSAKVGQPDLIIVQSPPLFDAIAARMLAFYKHCPFIFMVSDLWPEAAIQYGALRNPLFIHLAQWLEWSTYQRASKVWVVTQGLYNRLIQRGLAPEQLLLITNGVDTQKFRPLPQQPARTQLHWDERFTVLYAGTHGLAYNLQAVLDAARQLRDQPAIHFILAGDGVEKTQLMAYAQQHQIENVTFLDAFSHDMMPTLLAAADLCLIPLRTVSFLEDAIPVKMLEIMACSRPFLLGAQGLARAIAEDAHAALYVEPENATALASAILSFKENPAYGIQLGQNGRDHAKTYFDYDKLVDDLDAQIRLLLGTPVQQKVLERV